MPITIRNINYVYTPQGGVAQAVVTYSDGTTENVSGTNTGRLNQIQEQLRSQNRQVLMEETA